MLSNMALIIPPGYVQCVLNFASPNLVTGRGAITLGFGAELGPDPTSITDWVDAWVGDLQDTATAIFDSQLVFDNIYVANEVNSYSFDVSIPGGQPLEDPPPNVAVLASYPTPFKGPRGRGRNFLYGVCNEGDISTAGILTSGRRSAIEENWFALIVAMEGAADPAVDQVILQNTTPTPPPANPSPPIDPPPVVDKAARSIAARVATQRRRLRR